MLNNSTETAILELDNPETGNSLSPAMVDKLSTRVKKAIDDPKINTLIIKGSGKNFCTGFDLTHLEEETEANLLYRFVKIEELLTDIWHAPLRTIAIGHGHVLGAGADLFTACDVRIAVSGTKFRYPGAAFGLILGTRRLSVRVGSQAALNWTSTGKSIGMEEALTSGLVNHEISTMEQLDIQNINVDLDTYIQLRSIARADENDHDLANLVRSITKEKIKERMLNYYARIKADRRNK